VTVSYDTRPTRTQYEAFALVWAHFNEHLFDGTLPKPMLTLDRTSLAPSCFAADRWYARMNGREQLSEISLNPDLLVHHHPERLASTLVHELTHHWQHVFGRRQSRHTYHDLEWSRKMESIGLMPSVDGKPDGARTGPTMRQYKIAGGKFSRALDILPRELLLPFLCDGHATRGERVKCTNRPALDGGAHEN